MGGLRKNMLAYGMVFLMLVVVFAGIPMNVSAESEPGLISYWAFDEGTGTMADDSVGDHDGPIHGASWVDGISGKALSFDGTDDYVGGIGSTSTYSFIQNTGVFTIESWIKFTDYTTNDVFVIVASTTGSAYRGFFFGYQNGPESTDNQLRMFLAKGSSGNPVISSLSSNDIITDNNWHHVAATGDGSKVTFYVDGLPDTGTGTMGSKASGDSSNLLNIGRSPHHSAPYYFDGLIDEIGIYDKTLSANEIKAKYDEFAPDTDQIAHWPFDEGSGEIAHDLIGDNDGILKPSSSWTLKNPGTAPSARQYHTMASVDNTDKVVLFGGWDGGYLADTWVYDLSDNTWTNMNPLGNKPTARMGHAIASISGDDKVVIFGGWDSTSSSGNYLYDTWVYDLSDNTWTNLNPATHPPDRIYHSMASITNEDKILLFGGKVGPGSKYGDTWIYDLSNNTWTQKFTINKPSPVYGPPMASIYNDDKIVLFGGYLGFHNYDDKTWVYDYSDNTWTNQYPIIHPSARGNGPMATIFNDDKVIMFGGYIGGVGRTDETWVYDLSDNLWVNKNPITKPSVRYLHQMVGIPNDNKVVLFGGWDGNYDGETWIFNQNGPEWVEGISGKALSFNGVDDYVEVPDDNSLDINDTYTVSAWFKCSGSKSGNQAIVAHGESFDTDKMQYSLFLQPDGKKLWAWYEDSGDAEHELSAPDTLVYNKWYHAAVVLTSDSQYRLYLDGVEKDSSSESAKPPSISNILTIGCLTNSGSHPRYEGFFNGAIDEVCIWNRALSANEIWENYNSLISPLPDLSITSDDITFSNPNPSPGEEIEISATVENIGTTPGSAKVKFWDREPTLTNAWIKKASMPTVREGLACVALNDKIYAIGGDNGSSYLSLVEEYDPKTDLWTTKTNMPQPRVYPTATVVNGKIYVVGGHDGNTYNLPVIEYDPLTNNWSSKANMKTPRYRFAAAEVNGKIYAIGGRTGPGSQLSTVEEYDPVTDSWSSKANLPIAKKDLAAASLNGKLYAIGGYTGTWVSSVHEYNPATNSWTSKADMPTARSALAAATMNGEIYAIGGHYSNLPKYPTVEKYDVNTNSWSSVSKMSTPRHYLGATVVDGKLFAIGGSNGTPLSTNEVYSPFEINATLIAEKTITHLAPGTSVNVTTPWTVPSVPGNYSVWVTIENCTPSDTNLSNNIASNSLNLYLDLTVTKNVMNWSTNIGPTSSGIFETIDNGDINNDGNLDIAAAAENNGGIDVWLGNGKGGWSAETGPTNSGDFWEVKLFDINKDGNLDVIAGTDGNGIKMWYGNGAGGWTSTNTPISSGYCYFLDIGDIDRDGNYDIVVAGSLQLKVYLNNSGNGWKSPTVIDNTKDYHDVILRDVNGDNLLDIIVANYVEKEGIKIWHSNGIGGWSVGSSPSNKGAYNRIITTDLNSDSKLDIIATRQSGGVGVWLGTGDGTWGSDIGPTNTGAYWGVSAVDINNDGMTDIISTNSENNSGIKIWCGNNDNIWVNTITPTNIGNYRGLSIGDLNNDSKLDIISSYHDISGWVGTWLNNYTIKGQITFSNPTPSPGEEVEISATVENIGTTPGSAKVKFWDRDPTKPMIWQKESGIRINIGGTYDSQHVFHPEIVKLNNNSYRLYYSGQNPGAHARILSAFSHDGFNFSKESGIRLDYSTGDESYAVLGPDIIQLPNGTYRMYYDAYNGGAAAYSTCIKSALSNDCYNWMKETGRRIDYGGPGDYDYWAAQAPCVIQLDNGSYRMYYEGKKSNTPPYYRILSAFSNDGFNWIKEPGIRVNAGGVYDSTSVIKPEVIRLEDGKFRLYYSGNDVSNGRILSALSSDGINFIKESSIQLNYGGTYGSVGVGDPTIIQISNNKFRMYHIGYDGSNVRILSATASINATLIAEKTVTNLAPGNSVNVTTPWTVPSVPGNYSVWVTIEDCSPNDINLSNNIAQSQNITVSGTAPSAPDLSITSDNISFSNPNPTVNEKITINATIHNIGYGINDFWTTKTNMTHARESPTSAVVNGKIYVIGGWNGNTVLNIVEEYDPATDTWTTKKNMPTARYAPASSVIDGKIYVIGGRQYYGAYSYKVVEVYDPATNTWITKEPMNTPRGFVTSSVVNGKIYAMGGIDSSGNHLKTVEEYDPASNTWTFKTSMSTARFGLTSSVVNGKIYAIGGGKPYSSLTFNVVEEYDPATDTWTTKKPMPTSRGYLTSSIVNGKIYVIGGRDSNEDCLNTTAVYDPASDTWVTGLENMTTERYLLTSSVVNGKIYAIGGTNKIYYGATFNEEYTPGTTVTANISFYDGDPETGGILLGQDNITVWGNTTTQASITWEATGGYHEIYVRIENVTPDDFNYSNNIANKSIYVSHKPVANAGLNQTVEQTSHAGAKVTLDGSGSYDLDSDPLTYTWTWSDSSATGVSPTTTFPLGTTTVTLTVSDGKLSDTDTVDITVEDTTPPEITVANEPIVLWPPNHKYHTIEIDDFITTVSDICDANVGIDDVVITSVSSDEPENPKGKGDGNTKDDIVIVDSQTVKLRAERQGAGNGRVYTINFAVTDRSGNTATGSFQVWVPHDKKDTAVDDGAGAGYTVYV